MVALVLRLKSVEVTPRLSIGCELVVGLERLVFLDYCSHLQYFLSLSLLGVQSCRGEHLRLLVDEPLHESAVLLRDTVLLVLLPEELVAVLLITVLLCLDWGSPLNFNCFVSLYFFEIGEEIVLFLLIVLALGFLDCGHRVVSRRAHFSDRRLAVRLVVVEVRVACHDLLDPLHHLPVLLLYSLCLLYDQFVNKKLLHKARAYLHSFMSCPFALR